MMMFIADRPRYLYRYDRILFRDAHAFGHGRRGHLKGFFAHHSVILTLSTFNQDGLWNRNMRVW
ncbi:hypothetical protein [Serratia quinivorans]|uniref:hypothetical protein n=1 Tax=Serratia quinivorans TaxID=137545 RepID=UPI003F94F560